MRITLLTFNFLLLYLSLSAQWARLGDLPFRDDHTNGFGFEGKGYAIQGGLAQNESQNRLWQYDPSLDEWNLMGLVPGPGRLIAIGEEMNGKFYFGFGYDAETGEDLNDLWEFNPADSSFNELSPCPCIGRSHPAFVAMDNKIFMGSGSSSNGDLNDWWVYDIPSSTWTQYDNIPGPVRHHPFQFGIDGNVYVGGGHISNWSQFDIATNSWSPMDSAPGGRVAGTQFDYNGLGFVLSGDDENHGPLPNRELFMAFDPEAGEWINLPPHPENNRWAPSSFIIGTKLYFFGGYQTGIEDTPMWVFDLEELNCLPPSNVSIMDITDTQAELLWSTIGTGPANLLEWKESGSDNWNQVYDPKAVFTLEGLEACTSYEIRMNSSCDTLTSNFTELKEFTTDGCCTNPSISFSSIEPSRATINWEDILAADSYNIRWRKLGMNEWTLEQLSTNVLILENLEGCTEYEFQLRSNCQIETIDFGPSSILLTKDCGPCLDVDYCSEIEGYDGTIAYINEVKLNELSFLSENDAGYKDFSSLNSFEIERGQSFELDINYQWTDFDFLFVNAGAWIDINGNGTFEESEKIVNESFAEDELKFTIRIPENTAVGLSKLRVAISIDEIQGACSNLEFGGGEMEDFCINVLGSSSIEESKDGLFSIFPNPIADHFNINGNLEKIGSITLSNLSGIVVDTYSINKKEKENTLQIRTLGYNKGIYFLRLLDKHGQLIETSKLIID